MLTIGTLVVFGRPKGKKRDGIITKINEKSYIVKTDDNHKGYRVSKSLVKEKTQEPVKPRFENEYVAKLYEDAQGLSKDELIQSLIAMQLRVDRLDKKNDELEQENKELKEDKLKLEEAIGDEISEKEELEEKLTNMTDEEAKRCESYWEEEKQRMLDEVVSLQTEVEDKQNEIEKLEEEIEALKDEVNDRVVIEDIANLFDKGEEADDFDWEDAINDMIIENQNLKDYKETHVG
jgi:chromosome segregation ATPase